MVKPHIRRNREGFWYVDGSICVAYCYRALIWCAERNIQIQKRRENVS